MIKQILAAAAHFDALLEARFGRPYHTILGIGIVEQIFQRLRELPHIATEGGGMLHLAFTLGLFALLLINQLAELSDHAAGRKRAARPKAPPGL